MPIFSFTVDAPTGQRIARAFGLKLGTVDGSGVGRPATAVEFKAWLVEQVEEVVQAQERQIEINKVNVAHIDIT